MFAFLTKDRFNSGNEQPSDPENNKRWGTVFGIVVLLGIGVLALAYDPTTRQHLDTANNIIRRYRCPRGGYPAGRRANGDCLCIKCPTGHRCPGGYHGRIRCSRGTYQDRTGQDSCKKSPPGYHNPARGAVRPVPCVAGTYQPDPGHWSCISASPGHYVPRPHMANQEKCPKGYYQNQGGQPSCKKTPSGSYAGSIGTPKPIPCGYGTYTRKPGAKKCKPSRPGHFAPRAGHKRDLACPKNTFQHCYGQMNCIPCPKGWHSPVGATKCTPDGQSPIGVVVAKADEGVGKKIKGDAKVLEKSDGEGKQGKRKVKTKVMTMTQKEKKNVKQAAATARMAKKNTVAR